MLDCKLHIYIGYDKREHDFFEMCQYSIRKHCKQNIQIHCLDRDKLQSYQYWRKDKEGATAFSQCRFLVPYLTDFCSTPSIFMDCDMLLSTDICNVLEHYDPKYACSVVKHPSYISNATIKMDNMPNPNYPRKNWSSFVLWNPSHPSNCVLTPELINTHEGSYLHRFSWLKDEEIGELSPTWNYLVGEPLYPEYNKNNLPANLHYTLGSPLLGTEDHNQKGEFIDLWHQYYNEYKQSLK